MASPRVTIVADDLTGAMDVAGPLADRGLATRAVASIDGCTRESLSAAQVVSVNADTRHLPPAAAANRVQRILRELVDPEAGMLIKKIDSTLRGNVVAETLAMLQASGRRAAVVAPAFPGQGRTVANGVVHVRGVPLKDTNFARDALSPPPLEPLHTLFQCAAPQARVRLIGCGEALPPADSEVTSIFAVDSAEDEDLRATVRALHGRFADTLLVGSAGIAEALADVCFPMPPAAPARPALDAGLLFVVGSRAEQSAQQVAALADRERAQVCRAPNGRVDVAAAAASANPVLVLQATRGADGRDGDAAEVAQTLAESVAAVLARRRVSVVVATGGDTAIAILERLAQPALDVIGNLLPGIPYSRIQVHGAPLWFVTKAGGFGARDAFVTIARRLGQRE